MEAKWFSARLKELREEAGLTQKQLAEKAGMALSGVTHLEQGLREPAWSTVIALCKALSADCSAFYQEPGMQPEPKRGRPKKADETPKPKKRKKK